jgi:predicted MFS family arabinose efflux permease
MLLYTLVVMVGFPHVTLLPGFVENQFGRSSHDSSILFGVSAFGSTVASLAVAAMADSPRAPRFLTRLAIGFGLSLLVVSIAPGFIALSLLMLIVGVFSGGFQTLGGAVIIRHTEPRYAGRVMSLTMLSFAGFGLMGLPIGALADAVGERVTLAVLGVVVLGVVGSLRGR